MERAPWRWPFALGLMAWTACHAGVECQEQRSESSPVVARGTGFVVTADDVAEVARSSGSSPRAALEAILAFEVLAAEAARHDEPLDDAEQVRVRQVMVQRYLSRAVEPQLDPSRIKEADVRALYDKGRGQFVHPRLVKVALLAVFTGARMKPAARQRQEDTARELATKVESQSNDRSPALFALLGHDQRWIDRQVSYGEVWQAANGDHPYPLAFGRAVDALHQPGDTTPLVCDESGCYLGRYLEERAPENTPFEAVAAELRTKMAPPWQRRRFIELTSALAGPHDIAADPDLLARVAIDGEGF